MRTWEENAKIIERIYGGLVDWKERFYACPVCGEPIYECDWSNLDLIEVCPICGFSPENDDDFEDCDYEIGFDPYMGCFTDDC